jgi:hypothetical protein
MQAVAPNDHQTGQQAQGARPATALALARSLPSWLPKRNLKGKHANVPLVCVAVCGVAISVGCCYCCCCCWAAAAAWLKLACLSCCGVVCVYGMVWVMVSATCDCREAMSESKAKAPPAAVCRSPQQQQIKGGRAWLATHNGQCGTKSRRRPSCPPIRPGAGAQGKEVATPPPPPSDATNQTFAPLAACHHRRRAPIHSPARVPIAQSIKAPLHLRLACSARPVGLPAPPPPSSCCSPRVLLLSPPHLLASSCVRICRALLDRSLPQWPAQPPCPHPADRPRADGLLRPAPPRCS